MDDKKLFLLDAYALIYRAYYALIRAPRVTSGGMNTSAIFGFVNTLDDLLRKENPDYIAVCFDPPHGRTFRHDIFPQYKAQRDAQPEDITIAIPYIKRILEGYRIPVIEMPGYEADDVIGTLSRIAAREGFTTYMMTPDKDYGQLVNDRVFMYRPALKGQGFEIRGPQQVCERYGIARPSQVIDLLALEGDVSDNIPGCPGVGEKTAAKLIAQWDSVENLLDHTADVKGALQQKIVNNAEQIRLSKFLATIKTDVPIDLPLDSLKRQPEDAAILRQVYTELEFRSFLSRLDLGSVPATTAPAAPDAMMGSLFDVADETAGNAVQPAASTLGQDVDILSSEAQLAAAIENVAGKTVALYLNARGNDAMTAVLHGIAFATVDARAFYLELPAVGDQGRARLLAVVEPLFNQPGTTVASHELKRDMLLLRREGIPVTAPAHDTSVAHYLLEPEKRHRLGDLALALLGVQLDDAPASKLELDLVTPQQAAARAAVVARLVPRLLEELERQQLIKLYRDIEMPMVNVLAGMEYTGVRVDSDELYRLSEQFGARIAAMDEEAYRLAGRRFNIASPSQVGEILFGEMKIDPKAKRTKTGAYSTTEAILEKYRSEVPLVDIILKSRALRKLTATYVNALPALVNPATGKIHTTYNQTVTATGRLSSTNPNLQNIPVRTDDGREIRRAFIPDDGDLLLAADYSQIELRLMADLSRDPDMVEAFASGADIHRSTAAKIYHVAPDQVTDVQRRNAKTANFGIIYGISAFGLSERLSIPRAEAKMLIDGYFSSYPHIKEYIEQAIEAARRDGYVTTVEGRKRMLPDITSRNAVVRGYAERNAVNAPLQGSAADIIKKAMIAIDREITARGLRSRMIMQVHDELVFNVVPDELVELKQLVIEEMEGAYSGAVRLEVSVGIASNWLAAH